MVIFGDKSKPIYEIEMIRSNVLTVKDERAWQYVHASSECEAKYLAVWINGDLIDFVRVELCT